MLTKSTLQQKIARSLTAGLLLGIITWITLLVHASMAVRASQHSVTYDILLGPLSLTTITKHVTDQGFTATISPRIGLLWLGIACLAIGGLLGWMAHTRSSAGK